MDLRQKILLWLCPACACGSLSAVADKQVASRDVCKKLLQEAADHAVKVVSVARLQSRAQLEGTQPGSHCDQLR